MKISIVSSDKRYEAVCKMLRENGYVANICPPSRVDEADLLLLSVRKELSDSELGQLFSQVSKETVVLCGEDERISGLFNGKKIVYSQNCDFLQRNASLTAEATVSFLHALTKEELKSKVVFVSGYGRIGRRLCKCLRALDCYVFAYARREKVRCQMLSDGICPLSLEDAVKAHIIVNTVPSPIFSKELIEKIPKETYLVELASLPYGFEDMERVVIASGLPGKILPRGAAKAIYDTVSKVLSETVKE